MLDGVLILIGGAAADRPRVHRRRCVGALALLPPTRSLLRRALARNLQSRVVVSATRFGTGGRPYDVDSTASDVDSTATDVDPPQLRP